MKDFLLLVITCPAWTDNVILPARKDLSYRDIPEIIKQSPPLNAEKSKILVSSLSFYSPQPSLQSNLDICSARPSNWPEKYLAINIETWLEFLELEDREIWKQNKAKQQKWSGEDSRQRKKLFLFLFMIESFFTK